MNAGRRLVLLILLSASVLLPSRSESLDTIIVTITLNGEPKGEFFLKIAEGGDLLVGEEDLRAMGMRDPSGKREIIEGEPYVPLESIEGINADFNEKALSIEITVPPDLLPRKTIDLLPPRHANVHYPKDSGGFFNYGVSYTDGNSSSLESLDATGQLGVRTGDFLLLSDSSYTKTPADEKFVRLMSSVNYDRRNRLDRWVLGDFFASSGDLGGSLNIGGIGYSKVYRIDPYFIRYPLADFSGLVSLPSQAEIYLNGTRIRTEKIAPGGFELRNLSYYGGASTVSVVIKDPFGREQQLSYPFYFTDILLRKGLHEFSYSAGFVRERFGEVSNRYNHPAFSAFHNYGFSDSLTAGLRGEGADDLFNLGPQVSYLIPGAGVATLSVSGSLESGRAGAAGSFAHTYQSRGINTQFFLRGFSRNYAVAGEEIGTEKVKYEVGAGIGYGGTRRFGSLSLDFNETGKYQGQDRRIGAITYSRILTPVSTLTVTWRNIEEQGAANEFFAGITYYPWKDISLSASYRREGETDTGTVQVQKNQPMGEGFGYRATLERADSPVAGLTTISPSVQYNARHAIYSGEYRGEYFDGGERSETYRVSASGGIAYVARTFGFSRPISDSFGLVEVGDLEGVRVYQNHQEIGRTDKKGRVFLPELGSYYENQVSINDKDIPIDYSLPEVVKYVSPPLRSGSLIPFEARKIQAITGTLEIRIEGEARPAEFCEVRVNVEGKEISFPTGRGGEFYLENIRPGSYEALVHYMGKTCLFELTIPESSGMIVELGGMLCENLR
jgi:outer membrane usher protein FimD/PapC